MVSEHATLFRATESYWLIMRQQERPKGVVSNSSRDLGSPLVEVTDISHAA